MGRAIVCPLCRSVEVSAEEIRYTTDMWSNMPLLAVEVMLALVCRRCRHVQVIHPLPERPVAHPIVRN
jgi:hypothetical protein